MGEVGQLMPIGDRLDRDAVVQQDQQDRKQDDWAPGDPPGRAAADSAAPSTVSIEGRSSRPDAAMGGAVIEVEETVSFMGGRLTGVCNQSTDSLIIAWVEDTTSPATLDLSRPDAHT